MITNALRSLWAEPRAAAVPERVSRDWVLVGALMVTALLEGFLRDDVASRPFVTIVAVGLAPVLLWRVPTLWSASWWASALAWRWDWRVSWPGSRVWASTR